MPATYPWFFAMVTVPYTGISFDGRHRPDRLSWPCAYCIGRYFLPAACTADLLAYNLPWFFSMIRASTKRWDQHRCEAHAVQTGPCPACGPTPAAWAVLVSSQPARQTYVLIGRIPTLQPLLHGPWIFGLALPEPAGLESTTVSRQVLPLLVEKS